MIFYVTMVLFAAIACGMMMAKHAADSISNGEYFIAFIDGLFCLSLMSLSAFMIAALFAGSATP